MANFEKSIDIDAPVREVYDQWTQFEEFPKFMDGVESVHQTDDTHLHWIAQVAGQRKEWDAEITEQTPDQRIAWASSNGDTNAGVVNFHPIEATKTRVRLQLDYEPDGVVEAAGSALGFVTRRVEGDLDRFKTFIEDRGAATGGWRGTVGNTAT